MQYVVLALALLPAAAMAEENGPPAKPVPRLGTPARPAEKCQNVSNRFALGREEPVRARPLAAEPLANQYLGVLRIEDGCDVPVKIRSDIGLKRR